MPLGASCAASERARLSRPPLAAAEAGKASPSRRKTWARKEPHRHDPAGGRTLEQRQGRRRQPEQTFEMTSSEVAKPSSSSSTTLRRSGEAGIGDERVEPAEGGLGRGDETAGHGGIREIAVATSVTAPVARQAAATASARSRLWPVSTRRPVPGAASRRQRAAPMPLPAPVTSTTLSIVNAVSPSPPPPP